MVDLLRLVDQLSLFVGKKQHVVRTVMNGRTVMITMDRDQKKHIWILIFMDLIGFYLTLIYIWICGLLEDIVELLNLLWNLWCTLVAYHIGHAIAAVAITIPTLEHTSYYAVSNMCC